MIKVNHVSIFLKIIRNCLARMLCYVTCASAHLHTCPFRLPVFHAQSGQICVNIWRYLRGEIYVCYMCTGVHQLNLEFMRKDSLEATRMRKEI